MTGRSLLHTPFPYRGESLMGFILRQAECNGYETPAWIFNQAGLRKMPTGEASVLLDDQILNAIAELANRKRTEIDSLRARPASPEKRKQSIPYVLLGRRFPPLMVRFDHTKVCPECLKEAAYIRSIWSVAAITACPVHESVLVDRCPSCGLRIGWHRSSVTECRCGYDLRDAQTSNAESAEVMLSQEIHEACGLPCGQKRQFDNMLLTLELEEMLPTLLLVTEQLARIEGIKKHFLAQKPSKVREMFIRAAQVFDQWPLRFYSFLEDVKTYYRKKHKSRIYGISRDYGSFYLRLYQKNDAHNQFIRDAFREYIRSHWTEGYFASKHIPDLQTDVYVTRGEAAELLHISEDKVPQLVRSGSLKGAIIKKRQKEICLVDRFDILNQKAFCANVVNLGQAIKHLGLERKSVMDLVKKGILRRTDAEHKSKNGPWNIQFVDIVSLMMEIIRIASQYGQQEKSDTYDFYSALSSLMCIKQSAGGLLQAVLSGEIQPCHWNIEDGIKRLSFTKTEIYRYRDLKYAQLNGDLIPISKAARLLGMKVVEPLYFLVKKGFIDSLELPGRKHAVLRIDRKILAKFMKKYIAADEIARRLKISGEAAAALAINYGALPISGANVDGGLQYIFTRESIKKIALHRHVRKTADPKQILQDEHAVYLSSQQIKNSLHLSATQFLKYCDAGDLKQVWPAAEKTSQGCTRYYHRSDVLALQAAIIEYEKHLTYTEAAGILGESNMSFYNNWVLSGRLKRVWFREGSPGRCRFVRAEVEEARRLKTTAIRGAKAAEILDINPSTFGYWRQIGKIEPVSGPSIDGYGYYLYATNDIERIKKEKEARDRR